MMRIVAMHWRSAVYALLIVLLAACQGVGSRKDLPSELDAQTAYLAGDFRVAADAYLQLARANRADRARYRLRAAEALRQEGDVAAYTELLSEIDRERLPAEDLPRLDLLYAELALERGEAAAALALLIGDPSLLTEELRPRYFELRARAHAGQKDWLRAARERVRLDEILQPGPDREANAKELRGLLQQMPEEALREQLRGADRDDQLYPFLLAAARELAEQRGAGGSFATEMAAAPAVAADAAPVQVAELERGSFGRVALILPESGPLAQAAQAVRDGVFAAYFADREARPALKVYRAGGTVEETIAVYRKAVEEGADRVLGPMDRESVTALFQSNVVTVPTLTLNYADAPALPPPGSLQFALLPEEEAAGVAERLHQRGLTRALVLVPNDEFGARSAAAFGERLRALGGQVVGQAEYDPAATDQSAAIRKLIGVEQSQARVQFLRGLLGMELKMEPTPRPDVDALFLVARAAPARLLLPQLRSVDATRWPIYATSAIYGGAPSAADGDLSGVEFAELPWLLGSVNEPSVPTRAQVAGVPTAAGPAARLFAFGVDAWRLMPHLEWLERNPGQPVIGATGTLSADAQGRIRRQPAWGRFTGGGVRAVD